MRYNDFKIILEYDRSKTAATLGSAILQRSQSDTYLKNQGGDPVDTVISAAEQADPTQNQQYVTWILRQYIKNQLKYEDIYKLKDDLETFVSTKGQHKRLGINSDIGQYDWRSLAAVAKKLGSTDIGTVEPDAATVEDADILYNGPLGILSVPRTQAASCKLGSGTKWCTAAAQEKHNRFSYYTKYGPLYVWHDKKRKEKYQFHFETGQFMDAQDNPLTAEDARYFIDENPVTKKFFQQHMDEFENVLGNLINYLRREREDDETNNELEEMAMDANFDFILYPYSGADLVYYYKQAKDELAPHIRKIMMSDQQKRNDFEERYIQDNPPRAQEVADFIYRGPAPHLEDIIATDGRSSYLYAYHSLGQQRFKKGESEIAKDGWAALSYATKILKRRWPEAEPTIKQWSGNWKQYQAELGLTA